MRRGHRRIRLCLCSKILLLQRWYQLSDPQAEEQILDRFSFLRFIGLSVSDAVPDHSTICRFRNSLNELGLYEELFEEINRQFEKLGLIVKETVIVDATVVESSRRPKNKEDEDYGSGDKDAKWVKKGKKYHYGYKGHTAIDANSEMIIGGHITSANVSDMNQLEAVVDESNIPEGATVMGDKGYSSEQNRQLLEVKGYEDGIMIKGSRSKSLSEEEKEINKTISKIRYKIEHVFGTLKRIYGWFRMRYLGLKKSQMEFFLNAMAFNLKKATVLI